LQKREERASGLFSNGAGETNEEIPDFDALMIGEQEADEED
jgi:hypothetical protein